MWTRLIRVFTWNSYVSGIILQHFMMMLQQWFWLMKRFLSYEVEFFIIDSFLMCMWILLPVFICSDFLGLLSNITESLLPFQKVTIFTISGVFSKRVSGITSLIFVSFAPPTQSNIFGTLYISSLSGITPFSLFQK